MRDAFEAAMGWALADSAWEQATLPIKRGGLGLKLANGPAADADYVNSRIVTHDRCAAIRREHTWDASTPGADLATALDRINEELPVAEQLGIDLGNLNTKGVGQALEQVGVTNWLAGVGPADWVRQQAYY